VVPYVPIPLGGMTDPDLVRAVFDLDSWIKSSPGVTLSTAREAFWDAVAGDGAMVGPAGSTTRLYHHPGGIRNPRRRPFRSGAITEAMEKKIITAIIVDLSVCYGVKINSSPNLELGMATPVRDESGGRIIVIGASHLYRTVEYLPANTVSLATPGFKLTKEKVTELERRIDALELSSTDTVVLDLLSNTAYMGTDDEGLPLPAFRSGDGSYHVAGMLTTAPPTTLKRTLDLCTQIGKKLANTKVILVCPTPRYVLEKCCNDPNHIDNFNNDDYGDDLTDFQDQHRRLLGGWGVSLGLNFDIFDLTAVVGPVELTLGKRTTSTGASIWSERDSVHLSREAYMDAASAIIEVASGSGNTGLGDSASSAGTSDSLKRKQPDSVVTFPFQPPKRKLREDWIGAGWMRGEEDRRRGRGRGGPQTARGSGPRGPGSGLRPDYGPGRGWSGRGHRGQARRPW
jgi:hypothetical protein